MRPVRRVDTLATFMFRLTQDPGIFNLLKPLGPIYARIGIVHTFTKTRKANIAPCKMTQILFKKKKKKTFEGYNVIKDG